MRIEVIRTIPAPRVQVWAVLTDWERQPQWMLDATAVEVLTPQRTGVGVTIRCPTNLLGVTVDDVMRVTEWRDGELLAVIHLGRIITGHGAFELSDGADGGTVLRWWEEVQPPLGVLGALGARMVVAPYVTRLFARSLERFESLVTGA